MLKKRKKPEICCQKHFEDIILSPEIYCPKHFEDIILSSTFVVKFNLLDGTQWRKRDPRLLHATPEQLADCELWDDGIHWDALDEDVRFERFNYVA